MNRGCVGCAVVIEVPSFHTKYCKTCKVAMKLEQSRIWKKEHYDYKPKQTVQKPKEVKHKKMTKGDWIVELLKRNPASKETICNYIKSDWHTARQLITNMRFKGYNISLNGKMEYDLVRVECDFCHKKFISINRLRNHHGHVHK